MFLNNSRTDNNTDKSGMKTKRASSTNIRFSYVSLGICSKKTIPVPDVSYSGSKVTEVGELV